VVPEIELHYGRSSWRMTYARIMKWDFDAPIPPNYDLPNIVRWGHVWVSCSSFQPTHHLEVEFLSMWPKP
jgi:hypothetical protein